ncbi:hypothetical protein BpHYR1_003043 [Brachionus plicatilis]|uniref:Uncharacterized protein n=1 Tax=Brachionus plicatilis TaxID=10195 RepID=A0A3M7QZK7_BRAPC|nr:hypothetical protein BpHYR1_003043 [Brachionus plicatilis]
MDSNSLTWSGLIIRSRYIFSKILNAGSFWQRSSLNKVASKRERCLPAGARTVQFKALFRAWFFSDSILACAARYLICSDRSLLSFSNAAALLSGIPDKTPAACLQSPSDS